MPACTMSQNWTLCCETGEISLQSCRLNPIIAVAPAIAKAIHHAIGKR